MLPQQGMILLFLAALFLLMFVVYLIERPQGGSTPSPQPGNGQTEPDREKCSDGTLYGQCSAIQPKYCDNGALKKNCQRCGCPASGECDAGSGECSGGVSGLGSCQTLEGVFGITGQEAVEGVQFKWNFQDIQFNECLSFFCDQAQFSIALSHRLEKIGELRESGNLEQASTLTKFEALLIADNYSEDFQKDFSYYYSGEFFDTPAWFEPWAGFFSDAGRLSFSPRDISSSGSGVYNVELEFDFEGSEFEFFREGAPAATIKVVFSKKEEFGGHDSVFHRMPFNGMVGTARQDEDGEVERKDYGLGFSGIDRIVLEERSGEVVDSSASGGREFVVAKPDTFESTNQKSGLIGFISEEEGIITFAPGYAAVVAAGLEFEAGKGDLFYRIEGAGAGTGGRDSLSFWTTVGQLRLGSDVYSGEPLELKGDEKADSGETCEEVKQQGNNARGFHFSGVRSGQPAIFESFFFVPLNKGVMLESACPGIVFATDRDVIAGTNKGLQLDNSVKKISKFYELLNLIKRRDICVSGIDGLTFFNWSASALRGQEEAAIAKVRNELLGPGSEHMGSSYAGPGSAGVPASWDWRDRHGANDQDSDYYMGPDGWFTETKHQGDFGSCSAFAGVAAIEAMANIYYNRNQNLDLAEQDLVSCGNFLTTRKGMFVKDVFKYAKESGVVKEECFPYAHPESEKVENPPCERCANFRSGIVKISGYGLLESGQKDEVKRALIEKGPLVVSEWTSPKYPQAGGHANLLVGWGKNPKTDEMSWILRESKGTEHFEHGFEYETAGYQDYTPQEIYFVIPPITISGGAPAVNCYDRDADGYCYWGMSEEKPAGCPGGCLWEKDCDDSDPALGPFDERYNCKRISGQGSTAVLKVRSIPRAMVKLDGKEIGMTPMLGLIGSMRISAGNHKIKISRQGFKAFTQDFEIKAGRTKEFDISLAPSQ